MNTKLMVLNMCLFMSFTLNLLAQSKEDKCKSLEEQYSKQNTGYVSKERIVFSDLQVEDQKKKINELLHSYFKEYDFSALTSEENNKFINEVTTALAPIHLSTKTTYQEEQKKDFNNMGASQVNIKDKTRAGTADEQFKEIMLKIIEQYGIKKSDVKKM